MTVVNTDCIEKTITLRAPRSRVWRAISTAAEFGTWFQVRLEGEFAVGETIRGQVTYPGCDNMTLEAHVVTIEPEHTFAFRWCPYAHNPNEDYSSAPTTLVEFRLEDAEGGTQLTVTESGFDAIPEEHRAECLRRNEGGWNQQMKHITSHVDG